MEIKIPNSMSEYYEYYLTLHQNRYCRRLHFIGQCATITYTILVLLSSYWLLLLFAPLVVYPFAWSGHYFYEKNEPAAFSSPIRAKAADWLMFRDILLGRLEI
jgi:hypothetical protein